MNEIIDKVKEPDDIMFLIEQHKREIWEWKQKESKWVQDKNLLEGSKRIINEISSKMVEMGKANVALKKRAQEAEGETTIVKGIGMNSPEMKAAQAKLKEAEEINKLHQELNGKLQTRLTEVEEDNKTLAKQIEHLNNRKS